MKPSPLLLVALSLAVTTVAAPAHAQRSPTIIEQDRAAGDHADELFRAGNTLAKKDRWTEAEPLFREAWGLKRSYDIGGNLGIAEAALGRFRDAADHLSFALRSFPANGKPEHRKLLEGTLAKALSEVTALTVKVMPDGAEVLVDGRSVGTAPIASAIFVEPGARKVEARLAGYETAVTAVDAVKGGASEVGLTMRREEMRTVPPVAVKEGWRPGVPVLVTGGALAVVGLAAGIGLTVAANGKGSDVTSLGGQVGGPAACLTPSSACTSLRDAAASRDRLSSGALWTFVGGGVSALVTAGLGVWVLAAPRGAPPVQVVPVVGTTRGGVEVRATW
jgi:hypothetical protein